VFFYTSSSSPIFSIHLQKTASTNPGRTENRTSSLMYRTYGSIVKKNIPLKVFLKIGQLVLQLFFG